MIIIWREFKLIKKRFLLKINSLLIFTMVMLSSFIFIKLSSTQSISFLKFDDKIENQELVNIYFNNSIIKNVDYIAGRTSSFIKNFQIEGTAIKFDSIGNSFFTGTIITKLYSESDFIIGKQNSTGFIEWIIQYNYLAQDEIFDLAIDEEKNRLYVVGTTINESRVLYSDIFLGCYDLSTGQPIWNTTYGESLMSEIAYEIELIENKIYLIGIQTQFIQLKSENDILFACFTENGSLIWELINYTNFYDSTPTFVYNEASSDFFLAFNRKIELEEVEYEQFILQRLNKTGNVIWVYVSDFNEDIRINKLINSNYNNSILLIGEKFENNSKENKDIVIYRFNYSGEKQQEIIWGRTNIKDIGLSITEDISNNIIFSGYTQSQYTSQSVAFITKVDYNGEIIWYGIFEHYFKSKINSIIINSDNFIATTGICEGQNDFIYRRLFVSYTIDEDEDGLSSFFEKIIGTNPLIFDTDGDGFSDGQEYRYNTDPLKKSSNLHSRFFWNYFSVSFTCLVILIFTIVNYSINAKEAYNKKLKESEISTKTPIVRLFEKLISYFKIKK